MSLPSTATGVKRYISVEAAAEIDAVFSVYDDGGNDGRITREELHESEAVRITYTPRGNACRVVFEISSGYPTQTPIHYDIDLLITSAENKLLMKNAIQDMDALRNDRGEAGEGVLFEMIEVAKRFEGVQENTEQITEGVFNRNESKEIAIEESVTVIYIDHMNDPNKYLNILKKWCEAAQLSARVFWRQPTDRSIGKRKEGIYLCLRGSDKETKQILRRLRTEFVDVDSKGKKCKERKSSVVGSQSVERLILEDFSCGFFIQESPYDDIHYLMDQISMYIKEPALVGLNSSSLSSF